MIEVKKRVFVTGIGAVSAIGTGIDEMLDSLFHSRSGIGKIEFLDTVHADTLPAGEIKLSDEDFYRILKLNPEIKVNRTTLMAMFAAKEALERSGGNIHEKLRTGLISATTVGGMNTTEKYFFDFKDKPETRIWIDKLDCGDSTADVADYLGVKDYLSTISTACSSSANAAIFGSNLIKTGVLDRAICGGADALAKFTINGFNSLMLLEKVWCRPFDSERKGLNLGEGAGFIVLESEESVIRNKRIVLAELKGYANTNDAFHQTAASPDGAGASSAMYAALKLAGLKPSDIDYINAHGTGTPNNDEAESKGMEKVFDGKPPYFSSTKPFTGHTLGAAGGIEAVLSILAIQNSCIWPNLNYENPMTEFSFRPQTTLLQNVEVKNVLSNSFGFGGNNTSLLFSKTSEF